MLLLCTQKLAAQLPTGFINKKLTGDNIKEATAMAHAPDGRIFIAERSGAVKVFQNNVVSTIHTVSTTTASEQGLLGITLHPDFAQNGKCYIFYTNTAMTLHYLDVIVINSSNVVTSVTRVMQFDPIINGFHNGGALLFKNGLLYVAIGESNSSAEAAKLDTYRGKILRLTEDGQPAPGNPYYNEAGASRQKRSIWAIGMRNPWRMSLDPLSQKIFVANVGGNYEEIDDVTNPDPAKNYNYGWDQNGRSGPEQAANTITAAFYYGHSGWGCAITSGTFFNPPTTNYPAQYKNRFYFTDWCSGWMRSVDATPVIGQYQVFSATGFGSILGTSVGIDGNIYYFKYGNTGSLWRIEYDNTQAPVIVNHPAGKTVTAGDPVSFTVSASGATPFTYQWQKNNANISGATSSTYTIAATVQGDAGNYRCIVTNANGTATSNNAVLTVLPFNAKPVADITLPSSSTTWSVGDLINYSGNASDQEDGTLPASAFDWEVRFFHKDSPTSEHWHPGPVVPSGVKSGSFTADNGGESSPNIWLRIILSVTDSNGRIGKDSVDIYPNKVDITVNSNVPGLKAVLSAQGTTPFTKTLVVNSLVDLQAITPQVLGNNNYTFTSWAHGGVANQSIRIPAVNTTYTANYTATASVQNPYGGTARNIPGRIEAEDFDTGGQSIAYNDLTTGNAGNSYRTTEDVDIQACSEGGFNLGWVLTTEWLEYTINVTTAGIYTGQVRIATTAAGKSMHVELDGQNISGTISLPNTGAFQTWQTVSFTTPSLTTGQKTLRIVFDSDGINTNYIHFTSSGNSAPAVSITAPANNSTATEPATINIAATASDSDGTVTQVSFYNGASLLGTDTSAPYSYTWANVVAGTYTLTAQATDNNGAVTTSSPVNITVTSGGTVNLALNKPTTVSSTENASLTGAKAVDGNAGTRWSSLFSDPQWLYVDLGATYTINRVKITWQNSYAVNYLIEGSDNAQTWNLIKPITGNNQLVNDHTGLNSSVRYVRIYGATRFTVYGYSIFELEVYGTGSSSRLASAEEKDNSNDPENLLVLYPNPADGQVTIQYTVKESGPVALTLYPGQGGIATSLVEKNHAKGKHTITFDSSKLSAGIYYIKLKYSGTVSTRKLIRK
ncbi:MAG TPA: PQQ-dependent sugar dehydrogenase [Ohtaekwangia sp.]